MQDTVTAQPEELADGGLVGKFATALSERMFGRPPAPPVPPSASAAPAPAQPASAAPRAQGGAIGGVMRRREAAAGLADGGPVVPEDGVIEGPGTGTSDSIATEMPTGSYVIPADMTQALVSAGEGTISPETMAAASAAFMDVIKAALHTPADQQQESAAAPVEPPAFADGGLVDDKLQQIPTAAPIAPAADGSQNNPFTTSEVGRNLSNAAAALPGIAPLRVAAGAGRAASAGGAVATAERVHPAAWELVNEAAGPLSQAARAVPRALSIPGPGGQMATSAVSPGMSQAAQIPGGARSALSTVSAGARGLGARAIPSLPQNAQSALSTTGAGVRGASQLTQQVTGRTSDAAGVGLGRAAAATAAGAGLGAAALMGDAASGAGQPPATQFSDARFETARGTYADSRRGAQLPAPEAAPQGQEGVIYRDGNSYSGSGSIGENAPIVTGAPAAAPSARDILLRPAGISPQNELAAQNLSDRSARESLGRIMAAQQPAAAPATPFVASGGSFGIRRDPNIVAAERASIADFNRARGTDPRSLATAARERLAAQQDQGAMARTLVQDAGDTQRALIQERGLGMRAIAAARASGKAPDGYQWGADGRSLQAIPGGPADLKNSKEANQQAKDTQDIFSIIDQARRPLAVSTGSTLGNLVDKGVQAFGGNTRGGDAAAQLKVLQGSLISKMPKMSGPQSDKDVQLYREMAGQIGDPTIPNATRAKALDQIQALNEKYLPTATDAAAVDALPSGSTFRTPDGKIRRKP